jgi:hypothetical protein
VEWKEGRWWSFFFTCQQAWLIQKSWGWVCEC